MLWLKYWLETRLRLLFAIFLFVFVTSTGYVAIKKAPRRPPNPIPAEERLAGTLNIYGLFWIMPAVMLAAAGVKTQSPFQAVKGLHGSMHFTLSLPVSRRRLFSTRVAIGLLEVAVVVVVGCYGQWILLPLTFPELSFFPGDILRHAFTVIAGMTFFFFLSVPAGHIPR